MYLCAWLERRKGTKALALSDSHSHLLRSVKYHWFGEIKGWGQQLGHVSKSQDKVAINEGITACVCVSWFFQHTQSVFFILGEVSSQFLTSFKKLRDKRMEKEIAKGNTSTMKFRGHHCALVVSGW